MASCLSDDIICRYIASSKKVPIRLNTAKVAYGWCSDFQSVIKDGTKLGVANRLIAPKLIKRVQNFADPRMVNCFSF